MSSLVLTLLFLNDLCQLIVLMLSGNLIQTIAFVSSR